MENYENYTPENQPEEAPIQEIPVQPEAAPFQEPQRVKKASPFADSPYETQYTYHYAAPQKPKKVKKPAGKGWKAALCAILAIVLVAGSCLGTAAVLNSRWEDRMDKITASFEDKLDALEDAIADSANNAIISGSSVSSAQGLTPAQVYAMNVRSVVMVYSRTSGGTFTGSGFFLTADGYVVTNHHVIEGGSTYTIQDWDGKEYEATLVGSDSTNDVALLKVEGVKFPAVKLGSSDDLVVGDQVVAIGNPLGELTATQTVGYVSAKERDVNTSGFAINMIQTDAAINSGNSGGPLFNMNGEVVGITTAKYSGNSASGASIEGIGFAIPIDDVRDLIEDLTTYGYVQSAYLGISVTDMDPSAAAYYNMPVGAYVAEVVKGNCAYAAGVQAKDIIVALGGHKVTGVNSLGKALRQFNAGDLTTVTVYRGGQELELPIILDEKPQDLPETVPLNPEEDFSNAPPDGSSFEDYYNFFRDFFGNGGN